MDQIASLKFTIKYGVHSSWYFLNWFRKQMW